MLDLQVLDLDVVLGRVARLGLVPVLRDVYRGSNSWLIRRVVVGRSVF